MRTQRRKDWIVCGVAAALCALASGVWAQESGRAKLADLGDVALRYPGVRWTLQYGSYNGVEEFAVNELQRMLQRSVPYVLETLPVTAEAKPDRNLVLIGTAADNAAIAALARDHAIDLPTRPEGYTIASLAPEGSSHKKILVVAGSDAKGVLYGVEELNKKLAPLATHDLHLREALDDLAVFHVTDAPVIENRGLWTWGYVIYDYRRYIDNMARLKMNRLTMWNDVVPINCRQIIDYAHSRGIKVILGFSWGYALGKLDPTNPEHLRRIKENVLATFDAQYQGLNMDGVYFQTFTEQVGTMINGHSAASLARDWVNDIARDLLARHPGLRIEWGLHASSIRDHYTDLQGLDPRVPIVWEDAGCLPFAYDPETPSAADFDSTLDYAKKLAVFRPGSEFGMCAKGWIQMRWQTESEPHGEFILGERAHEFVRMRRDERQARWDYVDAKWAVNYPLALRFYRELRLATAAPITVVGLVGDGMFGEGIPTSVALLGETLWNPNRSDAEVQAAALNPYYRIVE